ncbi:MAG TPA: hypothetical protein VF717_09660, partial [Pyrinomonadaceae bacterium]
NNNSQRAKDARAAKMNGKVFTAKHDIAPLRLTLWGDGARAGKLRHNFWKTVRTFTASTVKSHSV